MRVIDARPHAAAVQSAIRAALGAKSEVYDYSTVPGTNGNSDTVPYSFAIVAIERRSNPNLRMTAQAGMTGWRVSVRCVATNVTNTLNLMNAVATALNEKRLTINGAPTTPIQFESDQTPEYDDGRYASVSLWTFAH